MIRRPVVIPLINIAIYLTLTLNAARPVMDADVWWHLAAGERILATGQIPRTDTWSYTVPGARWLNHEWLAELGMAGINRVGGFTLLFLTLAVLVALTYFAVHVRLLQRGTPPVAASLLVCAAFSLSILIWSPRPQMFTLLFLALWMIALDRFLERDTHTFAWLIFPLLIVLWSNVHGGYAVALGLMGISAVGAWIDGRQDADLRRRALRMVAWIIPSTAAAMIHPLGWRQLTYPLQFLRENPWTSQIGEWARPTSALRPFLLFEILLLATVVVLAFAAKKPSWRDLLVFLAVTHLALNHARHVAIWGVAAVPIIGGWLGSLLRVEEQAAFRRMLLVPIAIAVILGLLLAPFLVLHDDTIAEKVVRDQPVAATAALLQIPGTPRVFTLYHWAGYLIWRSESRARVFLDARADTVYPDRVLRQYRAVLEIDPEWPQILRDSGTDVVLLPSDALITQIMLRQGWRVMYRDGQATLLLVPKS